MESPHKPCVEFCFFFTLVYQCRSKTVGWCTTPPSDNISLFTVRDAHCCLYLPFLCVTRSPGVYCSFMPPFLCAQGCFLHCFCFLIPLFPARSFVPELVAFQHWFILTFNLVVPSTVPDLLRAMRFSIQWASHPPMQSYFMPKNVNDGLILDSNFL